MHLLGISARSFSHCETKITYVPMKLATGMMFFCEGIWNFEKKYREHPVNQHLRSWKSFQSCSLLSGH